MNAIRSSASIAVLVLVVGSNPALAQASRAERLQTQSQKLAAVEKLLNEYDLETLDHHLAGIDKVLRKVESAGPPAPQLTCLSNGQQGSYERFTITDATTSTPYPKATLLATCKQLIAVQNQGLICVSNGEQGSYEKFSLYDFGRKAMRGGLTDLKSCQTLVSRAHGNFVCHSNGQAGSYEKFKLFNRELDKAMGGETGLEQCLGSIPN